MMALHTLEALKDKEIKNSFISFLLESFCSEMIEIEEGKDIIAGSDKNLCLIGNGELVRNSQSSKINMLEIVSLLFCKTKVSKNARQAPSAGSNNKIPSSIIIELVSFAFEQ